MRSLPFTGGDTELRQELEKLADPGYKTFHEGLIPGASMSYGVRLPDMRALAQKVLRGDPVSFLKGTHPASYEETMVRGLVVAGLKLPWEEKRPWVEDFLPRVDNWAVCDCLSPKVFAKHKPELMEKIRKWVKAEHVYTCRFGLEMLMTHFLDADFKPEYLDLAADVRLEDYYAKMMAAWFFATALAKQWDAAVAYLETRRLEPWTHNKTIQKARESYRISTEQKAYLRTLKR